MDLSLFVHIKVATRLQSLTLCSWTRWMSLKEDIKCIWQLNDPDIHLIFFWTSHRSDSGEAVCTPQFPTETFFDCYKGLNAVCTLPEPGSQCWGHRVHIAAEISLFARNHSCSHLTPANRKVVIVDTKSNLRIYLTFFISAMISFGSLELVVFMDQVNLSDLGLTSPDDSLTTLEDTLLLPPGVSDRSWDTPIVWPWLPALPTLKLPSMPLKLIQ